jgi:hypothetical protein
MSDMTDTYAFVYFPEKTKLDCYLEQVRFVCDENLGPDVGATAGVPDDHAVSNFHQK